MRFALAAALALLLAAGAAHAFRGGAKSVTGWTAVCDNVGKRTAMGFTPDDGSARPSSSPSRPRCPSASA